MPGPVPVPEALLVPMRLVDAPMSQLVELCNDSGCDMAQKVDGVRAMVVVDDGVARGVNRRGEPAGLPGPVVAACRALPAGRFVIDGELLGDTVWAFDLVACPGGLVGPGDPYRQRRAVLETLVPAVFGPAGPVRLLAVLGDAPAKLDAARRLLSVAAEGVVFRRLDAPYRPGVSSEGVLRVKFRHTVDCVVMARGVGGKDNLLVGCYDDGGRLVPVAEVTACAGDGSRVKVNDVVEVTYLHATAAGRLRHPTLPRLRTDKAPAECVIAQLVVGTRDVVDWAV